MNPMAIVRPEGLCQWKFQWHHRESNPRPYLQTGLSIFMKVHSQNFDKYISNCMLQVIITTALNFSSFSSFFFLFSSFFLFFYCATAHYRGQVSFSSGFEACGVVWREGVNPLSYHQTGWPSLCIYGLETGRPRYPPRYWVARDSGAPLPVLTIIMSLWGKPH
jgi:hypothetical protein